MNKQILVSLSIISVVSAIAIGGTIAYFSDTETSAGNTFTTGTLDLKVDNHCYYNGRECVYVKPGLYRWTGTFEECYCTWELSNLDGKLFFNFTNVKPGDHGEDTVSLHTTNDAWVCAEITNLATAENGRNEPEADVDETADVGELQDNLYFNIWRDYNCDNIYNENDYYLAQDVKTTAFKWPIADSNTGDPLLGGQTYCLAIGWNVPLEVGNVIQSDSITGDVIFTAYQARHNENFLCVPSIPPTTGTVTVNKVVVNDDGGQAVIGDFILYVGAMPVVSGQANQFAAGPYVVSETGPSGYAATFSGDCDAQGNLTVVGGQSYSCNITNDDVSATLTVVKNVTNDNGGTKQVGDFVLKIDDNQVASGVANAVNPGVHTVSEVGFPDYTASDWGGDCAADGTVTINLGDNKTCTITNDDQPGTLSVIKVINGGTKTYADFSFQVDGGNAIQFEGDGQNDLSVNAGTYTVTEPAVADYTTSYNNCSNVQVDNGETETCTITNTHFTVWTVHLNPANGIDTSLYPVGASHNLDSTELGYLTSNNGTRYISKGYWSNENYTDNELIEFGFTSIPVGATDVSATLYFDWQRDSGDIDGARIRIWDGTSWTDHELPTPLPNENQDRTETIPLTEIDSTLKVNNIKVRFQAHDGFQGLMYTSHDWVQVDVTYTISGQLTLKLFCPALSAGKGGTVKGLRRKNENFKSNLLYFCRVYCDGCASADCVGFADYRELQDNGGSIWFNGAGDRDGERGDGQTY